MKDELSQRVADLLPSLSDRINRPAPDRDMWRITGDLILDLRDTLAPVEAERDEVQRKLENLLTVLREWGWTEEYTADFADDFAEEIRESGAWRLARDIRIAVADKEE